MNEAGYSRRSLAAKLGIKERAKLLILNSPSGYLETLGLLDRTNLILKEPPTPDLFDFIHFFSVERFILAEKFPYLKEILLPDGILWVSWPKRAAKVETDVTENVVREIGLRVGLVDVKVCAIDQTWSGLKFVYRLKDRPAH